MPMASASRMASPVRRTRGWLSIRLAVCTASAPSSGPQHVADLPGRPSAPSTSTRSHGTSTSSKTAMQSISSNRLDSGWSKRERGSGATVSRQMNLRPGALEGTLKASA